MKKLLTAASALLLSATVASAQSLMLDFGQTTVASPYLTTSPGHVVGGIPLTSTTWNKISSSSAVSSLSYADGTTATGITLTMGQEVTGGNNIINYSTAISNTNLAGTGGGTPGQKSLLGTGSIYGDDTSSTAVGRDGFFGGGTGTGTGTAIGLRIDGLAVGNYVIYVMARNTNSNTASVPMNIYTSVGSSSGTFDFTSLTPAQEANTGYATSGYANQYNSFTAGENYVALSFSIASGQSLFLAVDGANLSVERRGFLNSIQVVAVPEPSSCAAGMLGLLGVVAVARRRKRA